MSCDRAPVTVSYSALGTPCYKVDIGVRAMDRSYIGSGLIIVEHALEL